VSNESERILVPVDGSDAAERALDVAARLAKGLDVELEIVTVLDLSQVDVYDGFYLTDKQLEDLQYKAKEHVLEAALERLGDDPPKVSTRLLRGRAAHVLIEEAEKPGLLMIVMGRTGKGAFERLVQGSVSRNLAAHSPVPVTIVA
jgi:nucleotide-binding universal stress UspA family protein